MADMHNVRASWDPFLFEMQGKVYEVFPSEAPFLAELSGFDAKAGAPDHHSSVRRITREMDGNRDIFSGRQVRHTIILSGLPMGGFITETGLWNEPGQLASDEVVIKLTDFMQPFGVSVDVERDSFDNANAMAVAEGIKQARQAVARTENLAYLGDGTALQVDITDAATSLTTTVGTTANFDVLLPGTVWDIRTRATGADPGQGNRRKIASVNETTRVITWDTAQQANDGGSGSIVHTSADGIYIAGSYTASASAGTICSQGLEQAAAITGTFETIDKAAVVQWQGTNGRSSTTVLPLSATMLQEAVRRGRRAGLGAWDFGLGDPAAIDLYIASLLNLVRYEPQVSTLKSGYSGIMYDGADKPFPLIKEPAHKKAALKLIDKASFQIYGDKAGPSFLNDDGSMFRRFARRNLKEADLLDRQQLGVVKCNTIVFLNDLAVS